MDKFYELAINILTMIAIGCMCLLGAGIIENRHAAHCDGCDWFWCPNYNGGAK